MKILFVSYSRGWGFLDDTFDYVFKNMGAKHFRIGSRRSFVTLASRLSLKKYDVIWCEESGFIPTLLRYLTRKNGMTNRFYRNRNSKIITRFHFHNCAEYLSVKHWRALENIAESDMIIYVSEYWRRTIRQNLPFMDLNARIVHNGVDTKRYVPVPELKEENTIFYLASTYHRKRLHLLIQAMASLPDYNLLIGGERKPFNVAVEQKVEDIPQKYCDVEAYWDWCHQLASPMKDRILWLGFLSEEEKVRYYQKASIFVLPSTIESWGVVFMEAMSSGLPVIGTNTGGTGEFVSARQLMPLEMTPEELASMIRSLDGDENLGAQNRESVLKYDWSEIRREVRECLNSVM